MDACRGVPRWMGTVVSEDLVPYLAPLADDGAAAEELAVVESAAVRLREVVVGLELEVSDLEADLRDFRERRAHMLARLYARLDALDAAVAEELLARRPHDEVLQRRRIETCERAAQSATYVATLRDPPPPRPPAPEALRRVYHQAARRMHPDLGEAKQQPQRHRFMVLLNEAYERRDEQAINDLVEAWEQETVCVPIDEARERLARARRVLARLERTQDRLTQRLAELRASPEHRLMCALREDGAEGAARYDRLLADLTARIASAAERLEALRGRAGGDT